MSLYDKVWIIEAIRYSHIHYGSYVCIKYSKICIFPSGHTCLQVTERLAQMINGYGNNQSFTSMTASKWSQSGWLLVQIASADEQTTFYTRVLRTQQMWCPPVVWPHFHSHLSWFLSTTWVIGLITQQSGQPRSVNLNGF